MTKDAEIALLDKTIAAFGPESYLGPWLAEYRGQLIQDIRADHPPSAPLPSAAYQEGRWLVETAKADAETIRAQARQSAIDTETRAAESVQRYRAQTRSHLARVLQEI